MNEQRVFQVLRFPHISEKAAILGEDSNQHVFKVATDARKGEIKAAVEQLFKVKVAKVRTVNVKGKSKEYLGVIAISFYQWIYNNQYHC